MLSISIPETNKNIKSSKQSVKGDAVQQEIPTQAPDSQIHFDQEKATKQDIQAMKNFWKKNYTDNGFPLCESSVEIGIGKTKDQLIDDIVKAAQEAAKKDSLLFEVFYVGHGQRGDEQGNGAGDWCLSDGKTRITLIDVF